MAKRGPIVVAGNLVLDLFPLMDSSTASYAELFKAGSLINVGAMSFATGGCVANTGIALHKLGVPVRFAAKAGSDELGGVLRGLLGKYDPEIAKTITTDSAATTSYSVVLSPPKLDRIFLHHCGANDQFASTDVSEDHLRGASLIHLGYPPLMKRLYENDGAELVKIFEIARAEGLTTSLDMAMPDPHAPSGRIDWKTLLENVLPVTDFFLPSADEMAMMLRIDDTKAVWSQVTEIAQWSLEKGARLVMLKMGERGTYLRTGEGVLAEDWRGREIYSPCFKVNVAGTTGSGDATIAGFLAGWHGGVSIEDSLNLAVGVGACSVEQHDATSGVASRDAVAARMTGGWKKHEATAPGDGWKYDDAAQLWYGPHDSRGGNS